MEGEPIRFELEGKKEISALQAAKPWEEWFPVGAEVCRSGATTTGHRSPQEKKKKDPCKWTKVAIADKLNSKVRIYVGLRYFTNLV